MNLKNSVYKVEEKTFSKKIHVPSSKSYTNRALILGARLGNEFKICNTSNSTDVINLLNVFKQIGLNFSHENNEIVFHNSFPECEIKKDQTVVLMTGDGGTTNRFLVPFLSLGHNHYHLVPSEKMSERPMDELLLPLKKLGVNIEINQNDIWLSVKGPALFNSEFLDVDCMKSTQFASGLLLSFFDKKIKFNFENLNSSIDYLEMTKEVIKTSLLNHYIEVPVDFSSLSYPAVLAALSGEVLIENCHLIDAYQADSVLFKIFKEIGVDYFFKNGLEIKLSKIQKGFEVDGSQSPDLVMTLVVLASKIPFETIFKNLEVLKYKESNRLLGIIELLKKFHVKYKFDEESYTLKIYGDLQKKESIDLYVERDHRMVMMGYLMLRLNSGGSINNIDCVEKSYKNFFELD